MSIRVEFYGMPRQWAGVAALEVEARTLGDVFAELSRLPSLARTVFQNGRLRTGYLANVNAQTFTTDPATTLRSGDCVLILSADMGG